MTVHKAQCMIGNINGTITIHYCRELCCPCNTNMHVLTGSINGTTSISHWLARPTHFYRALFASFSHCAYAWIDLNGWKATVQPLEHGQFGHGLQYLSLSMVHSALPSTPNC